MKILGVIGGMGPLATTDFMQKLIKLTDAEKDSDHIHTIIDSCCNTPDRSSYILGHGEDPTRYIVQSAKRLSSTGADYLVMPCNTAHYFYSAVCSEVDIPFINMIEETKKYLKNQDRVGLLATEGTYRAGIYEDIFEDIEVIHPSASLRKRVNTIIYEVKKGIFEREIIEKLVSDILLFYKEYDVDKIILGCSELPIIFNPYNLDKHFIDTSEILARSAIRYAGKPLKNNI